MSSTDDSSRDSQPTSPTSGSFDPYHKWLSIPPEEQPPNHYRLLGTKPFESDLDVIFAVPTGENPDGAVQGVMAADLSLHEMARFLQRLGPRQISEVPL